jgi:hypothetical protein
MSKKAKDGRPPKKWFYKCVRTVKREAPKVTDPEALCAWIWYHHMKTVTAKQILADLPKAKRALKLKARKKARKKKGGRKMGKKKKGRKKSGWVWNPRMKRWVKRKKRGKGFIIRKKKPQEIKT